MNSFPPLIPVPSASEELENKFATLFSPPTPRGSPDLLSDSIFKPAARPIEQHHTPNSPDSEFGSFVSVPPSEDPLAAPNESSLSGSRPKHLKNPSLSFFDSFAQEAKAAHERNKREVMNELLYEDLQSNPRKPSTDVNSENLLDLDLDFFTPKQETPPSGDYISHHSVTAPRKSTLSPAIASTSAALSTSPNENNGFESTSSSSYQTLSHISSKWMPSLLKSSSDPSSESSHSHTRSQSSSESQRNLWRPFPSSSLSLPPTTAAHHSVHGAHSSPFASHVFVAPSGAPGFKPDGYDWDKGYSGQLDRELAAENELLEATRNSTPVSLNVPGQALSRRNSNSSLISKSNSQSHTPSQTPPPMLISSVSIGGLIQKKTGNLEMKGRREATAAVLTAELAEMIRSHLPALSRLPRTWNLLYSLDQHGISLHTLYDKCENQPHLKTGSAKVGAVIAMKDSGDAVFGVYMGDGVRQSKGKGYYGSGESFLWRYFNGTFQIFKWTGKNEYVALCEPEYLSFGGGDGDYGLYLDDSLFDGSSAGCPTFENEPLCSPGDKRGKAVSFQCVGLEVWGVGP